MEHFTFCLHGTLPLMFDSLHSLTRRALGKFSFELFICFFLVVVVVYMCIVLSFFSFIDKLRIILQYVLTKTCLNLYCIQLFNLIFPFWLTMNAILYHRDIILASYLSMSLPVKTYIILSLFLFISFLFYFGKNNTVVIETIILFTMSIWYKISRDYFHFVFILGRTY